VNFLSILQDKGITSFILYSTKSKFWGREKSFVGGSNEGYISGHSPRLNREQLEYLSWWCNGFSLTLVPPLMVCIYIYIDIDMGTNKRLLSEENSPLTVSMCLQTTPGKVL
jgi:hypothetical protein